MSPPRNTPSPFVVVTCHGSYHTPSPYQPFVSALQASGISAYCPQLPSSDLRRLNVGFGDDISRPDYDRSPPENGYPQPADDVVVLNELLEELVTRSGKYVFLVGHSSGAFTATMVAVAGLQAKVCKIKGESGGIVGIFYECGFLVPAGESVHSFFQLKDMIETVMLLWCRFHVDFIFLTYWLIDQIPGS